MTTQKPQKCLKLGADDDIIIKACSSLLLWFFFFFGLSSEEGKNKAEKWLQDFFIPAAGQMARKMITIFSDIPLRRRIKVVQHWLLFPESLNYLFHCRMTKAWGWQCSSELVYFPAAQSCQQWWSESCCSNETKWEPNTKEFWDLEIVVQNTILESTLLRRLGYHSCIELPEQIITCHFIGKSNK